MGLDLNLYHQTKIVQNKHKARIKKFETLKRAFLVVVGTLMAARVVGSNIGK